MYHFWLKCVTLKYKFLGSECFKRSWKVTLTMCESSWPLRVFTLLGRPESEEEQAESFAARSKTMCVSWGEVDLWKCATRDLMSDEEDGGVSGWIVRPPSFGSQDLTKLCATLQSRLESIPKYRHLQNGPNSDRMTPLTYSSKGAERHFM